MGNILLIDPVQDPRWDEFVERHPFGWICHLSGWKRVLENTSKHIKGYYLALLDDMDNTIQAALPIFEVRSWLTGHRLVSIPFATLCDPLISSSEEMKLLLESAVDLSKKLGTAHIEIRTFASVSLVQQDVRLGRTDLYRHHYLSLETSLEQLKKSFHRKVRRPIDISMKSDLRLKVIDNSSELDNFYRLYLITRKRIGLPPQPYTFFRELWEVFSPSRGITILLAKKSSRYVAGLILLKFKSRVSADYAAWDRELRDVNPNHYIIWEAIKSAHNEGYKTFDFGRTSPYDVGLMDFKGRWGTKIVDLPQFYYPEQASKRTTKQENSIGYKCVRKLSKNAPDFASPYIGRFCYRHLG